MSYHLLDTISGPLVNMVPPYANLMRTFKYGIECDLDFEFTGAVTATGKRKGADFTNTLTPLGFGAGKLIADPSNYDGWNQALLDEHGCPSRKACYDILKAAGSYRNDTIANWADELANHQPENCVSLLYNLLRMWLYYESDVADYQTDLEFGFYDDGRVKITLEDYFGISDTGNYSMTFADSPAIEELTDSATLSGEQFIPYLNNLSTLEVQIIIAACSRIEYESPIKIFHPSPKLVSSILQPTGSRYSNIDLNSTHFTGRQVMGALRKFVIGNRLSSQFDLAYNMLVTSLFMPMARTVEANGWIDPRQNIHMPIVSLRRGLIPEILQGVDYCSMPERATTWSSFLKYPTRVFVHAAAITEAMYCGFFEIATAGLDDFTSGLEAIGLSGADLDSPYAAAMAAVAYRYGTKYEGHWRSNAGADHIRRLMDGYVEAREIKISHVYDGPVGYNLNRDETGDVSTVHVQTTEIKPALFPWLSMAINDKRYYLNETSYEAELSYKSDTCELITNNARDANKAMCILSLAGYDASATVSGSYKVYTNWAPNSNEQVNPIFKPIEDMSDVYRINMLSIEARENNWISLPRPGSTMKFKVDITVLDYVVYNNGKRDGFYSDAYSPLTPPIESMAEHDSTAEFTLDPSKLEYRYTVRMTAGAASAQAMLQFAFQNIGGLPPFDLGDSEEEREEESEQEQL